MHGSDKIVEIFFLITLEDFFVLRFMMVYTVFENYRNRSHYNCNETFWTIFKHCVTIVLLSFNHHVKLE